MRILRLQDTPGLKPGLNLLPMPGRSVNVYVGDEVQVHFVGKPANVDQWDENANPIEVRIATVVSTQSIDSMSLVNTDAFSRYRGAFTAPKGLDDLFDKFSRYDSTADALVRSGIGLDRNFVMLWLWHEPRISDAPTPPPQRLPRNPRPVDPDFVHNFPGVTKAPPATTPSGELVEVDGKLGLDAARRIFEGAFPGETFPGDEEPAQLSDDEIDARARAAIVDATPSVMPVGATQAEIIRRLTRGEEVVYTISDEDARDVGDAFDMICRTELAPGPVPASFSEPQTRLRVRGIGREATPEERDALGALLGFPTEDDPR